MLILAIYQLSNKYQSIWGNLDLTKFCVKVGK